MEKVLHWYGGVVMKISDGTWLLPNARTRCYPENGAAEIEWDPIPFINMPACKGEYKYFQKVSGIKIVRVHGEEI